MTDSLTDADLKRISRYLNMEKIKSKTEMERTLQNKKRDFGNLRRWVQFKSKIVDYYKQNFQPQLVEEKYVRTGKTKSTLQKVYRGLGGRFVKKVINT